MAGYVNSWIEQYQSGEAPCIGETINESNNSGMGPIAACWVWLLIGAAVGSLLTSNNKKRDRT